MKKRIRKAGILVGCVLAGLAAGFFVLRGKLYPQVRTLARAGVKSAAAALAAECAAEQIASGEIRCDRLIRLEKNRLGQITALKTDMGEANRLKGEMLERISRKMVSGDGAFVSIPLGSLIFPEFFAGKGPRLPVRILAVRHSGAEIHSSLSGAAINQTLHRLELEVTLEAAVLVLGKSETVSVSSRTVIAETLILGSVPEAYLQTGG